MQRFNTELELKLSTYAVPYILGEIKRFLRDDGMIKVSRRLKELKIKINEIQREYINKRGEEADIETLEKMLKVSKDEIIMAIDANRQVDSIDKENVGEGLCARPQKDETNKLIDKICLTRLIEELEERDRKIILLRYYKEKTQVEVAKILGITQVQISRLEKKILISMRRKFNENT